MPKHISIESHLSLTELEQRYRQAKDPVDRSHYQIIWLLASGRSFENLDELEEVLFHRCKQLLQQQDLVRGLTNFHWWPQVVA